AARCLVGLHRAGELALRNTLNVPIQGENDVSAGHLGNDRLAGNRDFTTAGVALGEDNAGLARQVLIERQFQSAEASPFGTHEAQDLGGGASFRVFASWNALELDTR